MRGSGHSQAEAHLHTQHGAVRSALSMTSAHVLLQVGEDLWWDTEKGEMERARGIRRNPLQVAKEKLAEQAALIAAA